MIKYQNFLLILVILIFTFSPLLAGNIDYDNLITIQKGELPVVISVPHGGKIKLNNLPVRTMGVMVTDLHTREIADSIQDELYKRTGKKAYMIAAKINRKYVDFNAKEGDKAYENEEAASIYQYYQEMIHQFIVSAKSISAGNALLIDIHAQKRNPEVIFRGTRNGTTANLNKLYAKSGLITNMIQDGLKVEPDNILDKEVNFNGGNIVYDSGQYGIDAVQLEFGKNYTSEASDTGKKIADAIIIYLKNNKDL